VATDKKDQEFTKEQLEELQIDSALGGDIPIIGLAGTIGRKTIPKMLEAGKDVFKEVYEHYVERKVAKEAAKAAGIQELRASMPSLEEAFRKGVDEGKLSPKSLDGKTKGADLFAKNEDDLRKYLGADDFRNYAKLAIEDEKMYRETFSAPSRFLRAFHYSNANPEMGYATGPVIYGGSYNARLAGSAADSEMQVLGIMALSGLRSAAQVATAMAGSVKVAVGAPVDEANLANIPANPQGVSGDQALQIAFNLAPEFKNSAQESLSEIQKNYANLSPAESAKFASQGEYMEAAKRSVAKEILTMKLQPQSEVSPAEEKRSSNDHAQPPKTLADAARMISESQLPQETKQAMYAALSDKVNQQGHTLTETRSQELDPKQSQSLG
jgi:hypothetical protein